MSTSINLPAVVAPIAATTRFIPLPIHYGNPDLSLLATMYFPEDPELARKFVAHLLSHGTLQTA